MVTKENFNLKNRPKIESFHLGNIGEVSIIQFREWAEAQDKWFEGFEKICDNFFDYLLEVEKDLDFACDWTAKGVVTRIITKFREEILG